MIDTHCHLYAEEFKDEYDVIIQKALASGVMRIIMPNIDIQSIEQMKSLSVNYPENCFPMMGLHPCSVKENFREIMSFMLQELTNNNYVGIGETGIDLYWDRTHQDLQKSAFETHIGWAKEFDLPVIIHSRESLDLNIEIIQRHQDGNLRGIFHCFGGDYDQASRINDVGFKIGIGGVLTFKNSTLREVLPNLSRKMFVLETDSPYLTPVPYRGKRNEPSYLGIIAEKLSEVLEISFQEVVDLTTANAAEVFGNKVKFAG